MKLSIVATLYNSAGYIEEFCLRAADAAVQLVEDSYEIVLVNDGSPDNSLDVAVRLSEQNPHLKVVDLSRNFGHHKAMMAGLTYARGEKVFLLDVDLEESPEWLPDFSAQMEQEKCDVVYGVQESRKGGWFERWSGELYYRFLDQLLSFKHPRNITTARLMTRRYLDSLLLHHECEIVISGLWLITGFKQSQQIVQKQSTSKTTYSFYRKLSHLVNVVTSFSSKPLKTIFLSGVAIFSCSLAYTTYLVLRRLFFLIPVDGYTSIMVSVWLLGGLTILFVGIVGIYLSKVFSETKQRPLFIVRSVYGGNKG
ncbi:glycosyltransferase family 2 protein [Deltaproteobacteria bacterium IMCC39524]|nr:glycosyltransferase family 2 protein [Deltaproteobacteria bacterium IMCC39524]